MKVLISLFFVKRKAQIRNLFRKPSSAIMTILMVIIYGSMLIPVFLQSADRSMNAEDANILAFAVVGLMSLMLLFSFIQKKMSLFFVEDSHYMFIGPFKDTQILSYLIFDGILSSLLMGVFSILPATAFSNSFNIPLQHILAGILVCAMMMYIVIMIIMVPYLRSLISGKKTRVRQITGLCILVLALASFAYSMMNSNFDIASASREFLTSESFNFVPIIGWGKFALVSFYTGDILGILIGGGALFASSAALSYMLIHSKGYFYEQSMIDAADFTEYYNQMKSGKASMSEEKLKTDNVKINFRLGELAIHSKNMLIAKKTGTLLKVSDIASYAFILAIAFFMKVPFQLYLGMLLFALFTVFSSKALATDLEHHYVYLIPGNPLKKLLSTIWIPLIKPLIILSLMTVLGGVLLNEKPVDIILYTLLICSFVLILAVGNVVTVRVLKSSATAMMEQSMRMLIVAVAIAPSAGILWLYYQSTKDIMSVLDIMLPLMLGINLILVVIGFLVCAPMMKGNEIK